MAQTPTIALKPWLADQVSISLRLGRVWLQQKLVKKDEQPASDPDRAWAGIFADDGSSLEDLLPNTNGNLQVVKETPLTVTDGKATIVAALIRDPSKDTTQPSDDRAFPTKLNTIIAVGKYVLRYTAYGPPREKVTILLETASWLGEGRRRDAGRLKHITELSTIAPDLLLLQETQALRDRRCFLSAAQRNGDTMADGLSSNTQPAYATQVLHEPREEDSARDVGAGGVAPAVSDRQKKNQILTLLNPSRPNRQRSGHGKAKSPELMAEMRPPRIHHATEPLFSSSTEDGLDDHEPEWLQGRIPISSSVRVPTRQQSLLDKAASWHDPLHPHRFPDANIPIEILEVIKERLRSSGEGNPTASGRSEPVGPSPSTNPEHENLLPDAEGADGAEPTLSQLSWSESSGSKSPSPEPPGRLSKNDGVLPPDSSNDEGSHAVDSYKPAVPSQNAQLPVLTESSNEQNDSDDEMELDMPRGLGDDNFVSGPRSSRSTAVVQVKETPYAKSKNAAPTSLVHESGKAPKGTSSTSVIYGTYNDSNSPGESRIVYSQLGTPPRPLLPLGTSLAVSNPPSEGVAETNLITPDDVPTENYHHVRHNPTEDMDDDDLYSYPAPRKSHNKPSLPSPQVASAQPPRNVPEAPHLKRKLEKSPLQKSDRQSKRRLEIKNVWGRRSSPVKDTESEMRQAKEESERQFRDRKTSGPGNTVHSIEQDSRAGAQERLALSTLSSEHGTSLRSGTAVQFPAQQRPQDRQGSRSEDRAGSETSNEGVRKLKHLSLSHHKVQQSSVNINRGDSFNNPYPPSYVNADHNENATREQDHARQDRNSPTVSFSGPTSAITSFSIPHKAQTESPLSAYTHLPHPETIFQKFKAAYPEYMADHRHFFGQCKYMYKLEQQDMMVPKWQWDDFIIRHAIDYTVYTARCNEEGEEIEQYHRFYKDNIRNTLYTKGVVDSVKRLETALQELGAQPTPATTPTPTLPFNGFTGLAVQKPPRKSYPWDQPSKKPVIEQMKSTARTSLPPSTHGGIVSTAIPAASHRSPSVSASVLDSPDPQASSSSKSVFNGSAFNGPTGDMFRDYFFGSTRLTSLTGDTRVRPAPGAEQKEKGRR
ncbi:hypothetical protein P280DRAFT_467306 [Massarina eburnea CBS 473.64]|uniref:Telomere replication protein EST3 n=1 Tax=Massarina eburnea CBS 473.64 TaxID=1395130 RepID=A0A6A6S689_9PLEO|nr:hypothetical protein P280DRAFT_467306 [Massarina eburnea CBS 473.64]